MSYSLNKARQAVGLIENVEFNVSAFLKPFNGAYSMGKSERSSLFNVDKISGPGPGAYESSTYNKSTDPHWRFPKSNRKPIESLKEMPSPDAYKISMNIGKGSPNYTFGGKVLIKQDNNSIGPGSYNPKIIPEKSFPAFSFGYRSTKTIETLGPGPGTYESFSPEKKSILTNDQNKKTKFEEEKNSKKNKNQKIGRSNKKISKSTKNISLKHFDSGFSISHRDDLYNKSVLLTPGPGHYNPNFNSKLLNGPSHKFVTGEKVIKNNISNNPGPGYFTIKENIILKETPAFSIAGKYQDSNFPYNKDVPGPGSYNPKLVDKIKVTKFKSSTKVIHYDNSNPGPGQYNTGSKKTDKGIRFPTGKRLDLISSLPSEPGPGHYNVESKNQGPKIKMLGKYDSMKIFDQTPGPGRYLKEDYSPKNKGATMSTTKKGSYFSNSITPGPGKYDFNTKNVSENAPKYSFGQISKKKQWKRIYDPGPGSYDIPSTIAGIPNYLMNYSRSKNYEDSKFSENIKEVNESIKKVEDIEKE